MKTLAVRMPQMGQSAAEGTIVKWHKQTGDTVDADEVLVEVESDKINFEVESPAPGRLIGCIKVGRTVPVGDVIAMIETEADVSDDAPPPAALQTGKEARARPPQPGSRPHMGRDGDQEIVSTACMPESLDAPSIGPSMREWLSPSVMRLALQNNITMDEIDLINGSGRDGRITRDDVLKLIARRAGTSAPSARHAPKVAEDDTIVPMTTIRRTIADHMTQSIHTSAHVTMVHTVDMTNVVKLRERIKEGFLERYGTRMSYTAVLNYVAARVLRDFPSINASVIGTNIVLRRDINIGCAVALPDESLVVPVVKNADQRSFLDISTELARIIELARAKSLTPQDVQGGTFTISNFGAFGSIIGTPLINQPQVAILGMGAVFPSPVAVDGEVRIRDVMYLSFSFDHRVIDGAIGGRFLNRIQRHMESLNETELEVADL